MLEDATGKSLPAKDVFTHAIKFLKEDLKTVCALGITEDINESEVLWVLTVPAIWNEIAKRFMRQAAEAVSTSFHFVCMTQFILFTTYMIDLY